MAINIDETICKGCGLCVWHCPKKVMRMSAERNQKGYNYAEAHRAEECNECKMCEMSCPDLAIYIEADQ